MAMSVLFPWEGQRVCDSIQIQIVVHTGDTFPWGRAIFLNDAQFCDRLKQNNSLNLNYKFCSKGPILYMILCSGELFAEQLHLGEHPRSCSTGTKSAHLHRI